MSEPIATRDLIENARANATYESDQGEGGSATLVTLDADLFAAVLELLGEKGGG